MNIVFMGTPEIAVPALNALNSEFGVCGVFCQPDRPVGRKQLLCAPPVKQYALQNGIPCFQPATLKDGEALQMLRGLSPALAVVMAYGKILPSDMLSLPRFGCINLHASLLPKWRGSAPIQRAVAAGDTETGVTVMYMDEGMDTGDIISRHPLEIAHSDNAQTVSDAVARLAAECVCSAVKSVFNGTALREKQDGALATYAPMLKKDDGYFDFSFSARDIFNMTRGFCVWPCASFVCGAKRIKLLNAAFVEQGGRCGEVLSVNPLVVAAKDGALRLDAVVPEGKREMTGAQWAAGLRLRAGDILKEEM